MLLLILSTTHTLPSFPFIRLEAILLFFGFLPICFLERRALKPDTEPLTSGRGLPLTQEVVSPTEPPARDEGYKKTLFGPLCLNLQIIGVLIENLILNNVEWQSIQVVTTIQHLQTTPTHL
jgi:hypothetical protein